MFLIGCHHYLKHRGWYSVWQISFT